MTNQTILYSVFFTSSAENNDQIRKHKVKNHCKNTDQKPKSSRDMKHQTIGEAFNSSKKPLQPPTSNFFIQKSQLKNILYNR